MVESNAVELTTYNFYPTLQTAGQAVQSDHWRWYDDETNITPSTPMAGENIAPSNVSTGNIMKLRMVLNETFGTAAAAKFKLQYSEQSDFSGAVYDVVDQDMCTASSSWCYADGAGVEHATITARVLNTSDSCTGGVGAGCGTHNEYSYVPNAIGEFGTSTTNSGGSTVNLTNTYIDPIIIVESISGDSTGPASNEPAAVMITGTTSNSFTVRIQEPDDEDDVHATESFAYIVMERGAHTLPDGTRIDADTRSTSNFYGNNVSGVDDTCSFTQTFTNAPVVSTPLQPNHNARSPDLFTLSQHSLTSSQFTCAIEVPDGSSSAPTTTEAIGWIAIEPTNMTLGGTSFEVATTSESVLGWEDTWYEHTFGTTFESTPGVIASKQTRNEAEGGWVRFDNTILSSTQFAIDEADGSTSRSHGAETVGYIAFGAAGTIYDYILPTHQLTGNASAEYEWTLEHFNAIVGVTYFFRAYDVVNDVAIAPAGTSTYPSLATESGQLTFTISGVDTGILTEGATTTASSTPTALTFGSLAFETEQNMAHRISVTTNASHGYQILMQGDANLMSSSSQISAFNASNTAPVSWSSQCDVMSLPGCWGYHTSDTILSGGSTRFLLDDTYAGLSGLPEEIAYSAVPVVGEETDIVYRIQVGYYQEPGTYTGTIEYIAVPVF